MTRRRSPRCVALRMVPMSVMMPVNMAYPYAARTPA
jgi:hypothetical protein